MKPLRIVRIILFLLIMLSSAYLVFAFGREEAIVSRTRLLMGTVIQVKVPLVPGKDIKIIEEAINKVFDEIGRIENVCSVFKEDSEISRINRLHANEPLKISDEVFDLVERSVEYSRKTKGAFDITVKPLVDIWSRVRSTGTLPKKEEIKNALSKVGSAFIILDKNNKTITFKKEGMSVDLGGVAKGYATARGIKILKDNGIEDAVVGSGGDLYCLGRRSKKEQWRIGIQHPRKMSAILFELHLENKAIDTSGDYEKYFMLGGKRYSHIINPRTGYPIGDNVLSSTIIADDPATADILATALSVLGKRGMGIIKREKGVDAIIVFKEGGALKVQMSEGLITRYDVKERTRLQ